MKNFSKIFLTCLIAIPFMTANAATSEENRLNKKYQLNVEVGGINHTANSRGVEGAYFLTANDSINIKFSSLTNNSDLTGQSAYDDDQQRYNHDQANDVWKKHGEGTAVQATYKRFTTNSFYVEGGVFYRKQDVVSKTVEVFDQLNTYYLVDSETGTIEDIGALFSIGNQWQWENFALGVDWIGVNKSLTTIKEEGTVDDRYLTTMSLLNVNLGYTF